MEYEEITLDEYINNSDSNRENANVNLRGNFGCCDKYRQCSAEGKCLQSEEIGNLCLYKNNLDQGKIFYTKASPYFSQEKYNEIENHFQSLSALEKEIFAEVVGLVIYINRCAKTILCGKKEKEVNNFYSCVQNSSVFELADTTKLIRVLFENKALSCRQCQNFCDNFSDLPFSTNEIKLPEELQYNDDDYIHGQEHLIKNLTKQGKIKHEKRNQYQLNEWKNFFLTSGSSALNKFPDYFAYINFKSGYAVTTEEWAKEHSTIIPHKFSDLKYITIETHDKEGKKINSFKKLACFKGSLRNDD